MNLVPAIGVVGMILLAGCRPEVLDLVVYGSDAAFEAPDSAQAESDFDAGTEPSHDASTPAAERDARVRVDAEVEGDAAHAGCASKSDCAPQDTCSFVGCGSKRGTCVPMPNNCAAEPGKSDVCGCDGYKYFNDCLRLQKGVTLDPTCGELDTCDANQACAPLNGETTYCSRLVIGRTMCGRPGQQERACYVMPTNCFWDNEYYSSCDAYPTNTGTSFELCYSSLCDAIKSSADVPKSFAPLWRTSGSRCAIIPRMGSTGGGGFPGGGFTPQP